MHERQLVNETYDDVYQAFTRASSATALGWPVVFVGRDERYGRWFVWISAPCGPDEARSRLDAIADDGQVG